MSNLKAALAAAPSALTPDTQAKESAVASDEGHRQAEVSQAADAPQNASDFREQISKQYTSGDVEKMFRGADSYAGRQVMLYDVARGRAKEELTSAVTGQSRGGSEFDNLNSVIDYGKTPAEIEQGAARVEKGEMSQAALFSSLGFHELSGVSTAFEAGKTPERILKNPTAKVLVYQEEELANKHNLLGVVSPQQLQQIMKSENLAPEDMRDNPLLPSNNPRRDEARVFWNKNMENAVDAVAEPSPKSVQKSMKEISNDTADARIQAAGAQRNAELKEYIQQNPLGLLPEAVNAPQKDAAQQKAAPLNPALLQSQKLSR